MRLFLLIRDRERFRWRLIVWHRSRLFCIWKLMQTLFSTWLKSRWNRTNLSLDSPTLSKNMIWSGSEIILVMRWRMQVWLHFLSSWRCWLFLLRMITMSWRTLWPMSWLIIGSVIWWLWIGGMICGWMKVLLILYLSILWEKSTILCCILSNIQLCTLETENHGVINRMKESLPLIQSEQKCLILILLHQFSMELLMQKELPF